MASPSPQECLPRLISGSVVSVVEKPEQKRTRYMFELNLEWSDGTDSVSFRGYQDFFQFHCQLLDSFPQDSGTIKGCDRTIPYLPGKQLFRRSTKSLALQRLPKLNDYLQDLIKLPIRIITSDVVLNFLRDHWLEERLKYAIVPEKDNEDELASSMKGVLHVDDGNRVRFINENTTVSLSTELTDEVYFNENSTQAEEEEVRETIEEVHIEDIEDIKERNEDITANERADLDKLIPVNHSMNNSDIF